MKTRPPGFLRRLARNLAGGTAVLAFYTLLGLLLQTGAGL